MGLNTAGGLYSGGRIAGSGGLCLPQTERSRIVYCNQAHYGPVYGARGEDRVKGDQSVVRTGWTQFRGNADGGSGGGTYEGGVWEIRDRYGEGLNKWEDNVAHVPLEADHNSLLAYDMGLELHHPIIRNLGGPSGRIDIDR